MSWLSYSLSVDPITHNRGWWVTKWMPRWKYKQMPYSPCGNQILFFMLEGSQKDRLCGLVVRGAGYIFRGPGSIPALLHFLRSCGSGTGYIQPREYNWGAAWKKSSCSGVENREYGRKYPSRWPRGTLCPQNFADMRRSLGLYSSLADSGLGVLV
jgi:hypothetical protein